MYYTLKLLKVEHRKLLTEYKIKGHELENIKRLNFIKRARYNKAYKELLYKTNDIAKAINLLHERIADKRY